MPTYARRGIHRSSSPASTPAAFTAAMNAQLKPVTATAGGKAAQSFGQHIHGWVEVGARSHRRYRDRYGIARHRAAHLGFENAFTRIDATLQRIGEQIASVARARCSGLGGKPPSPIEQLADGLFFLASAGSGCEPDIPGSRSVGEGRRVRSGRDGRPHHHRRSGSQRLSRVGPASDRRHRHPDRSGPGVHRRAGGVRYRPRSVLPIASKAGVEYRRTAASLATLSNIGLDVDEGVTGIRQVLNLIVSPGKQATETMNELGIATEKLRVRLDDKGIINTLRFLERSVGGNEDQFRKLLPNIRAMTAAFGLTSRRPTKVDGIFRRVADSAGDIG